MDIISTLLKNDDYLRGGVYWCIRSGSEVSEELRKLMWKERVYFVEIDGFDELMAELYSTFNNGDVLPSSMTKLSRQAGDIASKLLTNKNAFPITSSVLIKAKERLERQSKRTTLANLIFSSDVDRDERRQSGLEFSDDELIMLTEVQNHMMLEQYEMAVTKAKDYIAKGVRTSMKTRLLRLIIEAYKKAGKNTEALYVSEELINGEPRNANNYLIKASLLNDINAKLVCIDEALKKDEYVPEVHLEKARLLRKEANNTYGETRLRLLEELKECLDICVKLDPGQRNACWVEKYDYIDFLNKDKKSANQDRNGIINLLSVQDPYSPRVLNMRQRIICEESSGEDVDKLLRDIDEGKERAHPDNRNVFEVIRLRVLKKVDRSELLSFAVKEVELILNTKMDVGLLLLLASVYREIYGNDDVAMGLYSNYLNKEFDADVLDGYVKVLCDLNIGHEAREIFETHKNKLDRDQVCQLEEILLNMEGQYEKIMQHLDDCELAGKIRNIQKLYYMLKAKKYSEAEKFARQILEPIHYSPEAEVEIVNLELARKKLGKKVDMERLNKVINYDAEAGTHAAIYSVMGKKPDMLQAIRKAMKHDKTFKFTAREWPVFEEWREDSDFKNVIGDK